MAAGTYTFTLYTVSGSANNTFTVTGSFTVTVYDCDDDLGVGDDDIGGGTATETGQLPVISALGAGAPSDWSIGDSFVFGGARSLDSSDTDDVLIPKVDGQWQTEAAVFSAPNASVSLEIGGTYTHAYTSGGNVNYEVLPCFTSGTMIKTITGHVLIDDLSIGDLVQTMDNGAQPIRWIGSCVSPAVAKTAPILFRKGVLGNDRDLIVSPQHRMLITGPRAELLFAEPEVLVPAKSLISDHSIIRLNGGMVTYFHILFDSHEIIFSNNTATESLHLGPVGVTGFDAKAELSALFPHLFRNGAPVPNKTARICLKHNEGVLLRPTNPYSPPIKTSNYARVS